VKLKESEKIDGFEDWLMNMERASPTPFPLLDELTIFFNFLWRADPNQVIGEYLFDDQLLPTQRNTIIDYMMFPFKKKFSAFMNGLSHDFSSTLLQFVSPKMYPSYFLN
jgi:hypothetical protein